MSVGARRVAFSPERDTPPRVGVSPQADSLPQGNPPPRTGPSTRANPSPLAEPHPRHPLRLAMEARDHAAAVRTLAWDVEMNSPVTPRPFVGREEVGRLIGGLIDGFEELRYSEELHGEGTCVVVFHARVLGRELHGLELLHMDEQGLVKHIEIGARPPAGIYALAAEVAPRFARWRRGRVRAALLRAGLRPLPATAALLDRLGSSLSRLPR